MHRRSARLAAKSDVQSPFRFLDLPAEIRNIIYTQAFSISTTRDLAYLEMPSLISTSRQIRIEARSIFCADSTFRMLVGCNYKAQQNMRVSAPPPCEYSVAKHRQLSGVLKIRPNISSFLEAAGEAALFRNIELKVYDSGALSRKRRRHDAISVPAILHIKVREGLIHVFVKKDMSCFPPGRIPMVVQDVDGALEKASNIAREIAAQDIFKGFKIADLERIAMAFRLE